MKTVLFTQIPNGDFFYLEDEHYYTGYKKVDADTGINLSLGSLEYFRPGDIILVYAK